MQAVSTTSAVFPWQDRIYNCFSKIFNHEVQLKTLLKEIIKSHQLSTPPSGSKRSRFPHGWLKHSVTCRASTNLAEDLSPSDEKRKQIAAVSMLLCRNKSYITFTPYHEASHHNRRLTETLAIDSLSVASLPTAGMALQWVCAFIYDLARFLAFERFIRETRDVDLRAVISRLELIQKRVV